MAARFVLVLFFIYTATAQPVPQEPFVEIVKSESSGPEPDGSYFFSFEDSAGGKREEVAQATGANSFAVQGVYSYPADDGSIVEVQYKAGDQGFQAESPVLPKAPPMPAHAEEQVRIGEDQRRQGLVFDHKGFLVGKN
ncbi:cuticle protein AMP2-like [Oratosquilla oratoria]|uniref:cuticle protein AMP2-like n=1 Tax=Oratosquilla oratoria TaxID=337810 RepID=UPI003F7773B7